MWPNGWKDQDETWHPGRPRPWPHCVRWGPSSPPQRGIAPRPQFLAHICCGHMAGWIKMALRREVGLNPSDIVLDGDQLPLPKEGGRAPIFGPCLLWPNRWMDQGATWHGGRPRTRRHCVRWGPSSPPLRKGHSIAPSLGHVYIWPRSPISATAELLF